MLNSTSSLPPDIGGGPSTYRKFNLTSKLAIVLLSAVIAYGLEASFNLNEMLNKFLSRGEAYNLDAVYIGSVIVLVILLSLKISDLRYEAANRHAAETQALTMAYHDPLTGLANRRKLECELAALKPGDLRAVLMIDLDDFKPINDIFGHAMGDAVLREAARRYGELWRGSACLPLRRRRVRGGQRPPGVGRGGRGGGPPHRRHI